MLERGEADKAATFLEPFANKQDDDQLVYMLDYGTALFLAGRYKDAQNAFLQADTLAEMKDYHSVTRIAGSLVLNEGMKQYKGDDFEKLFISVMTAQSFLMAGDRENAMVSVRKLNEKLEYFRQEQKKSFEQNTFALYLSALIREDERDYDNAYIQMKKAHQLDKSNRAFQLAMYRLAARGGFKEDAAKYKKDFSIQGNDEWKDKSKGEIVLVHHQGKGPRKLPNPNFVRVPKLYPQGSMTRNSRLEVAGFQTVNSEMVYDVESVAIKTLDDQYAGLIASRIAGIVAKEAITNQVAKDNPGVAAVMNLAMHLTDIADLRQWSTLPQTIRVSSVFVPAGTYSAKAVGLTGLDQPSGEERIFENLKVVPGKKTYVVWRSIR